MGLEAACTHRFSTTCEFVARAAAGAAAIQLIFEATFLPGGAKTAFAARAAFKATAFCAVGTLFKTYI
jgi:hypothetical protein